MGWSMAVTWSRRKEGRKEGRRASPRKREAMEERKREEKKKRKKRRVNRQTDRQTKRTKKTQRHSRRPHRPTALSFFFTITFHHTHLLHPSSFFPPVIPPLPPLPPPPPLLLVLLSSPFCFPSPDITVATPPPSAFPCHSFIGSSILSFSSSSIRTSPVSPLSALSLPVQSSAHLLLLFVLLLLPFHPSPHLHFHPRLFNLQ